MQVVHNWLTPLPPRVESAHGFNSLKVHRFQLPFKRHFKKTFPKHRFQIPFAKLATRAPYVADRHDKLSALRYTTTQRGQEDDSEASAELVERLRLSEVQAAVVQARPRLESTYPGIVFQSLIVKRM